MDLHQVRDLLQCHKDIVGGRSAAIGHLEHRNGLQSLLFGEGEFLADAGHGIDRILQLDLQQRLKLCDRVTKLRKQLIQLLLKV